MTRPAGLYSNPADAMSGANSVTTPSSMLNIVQQCSQHQAWKLDTYCKLLPLAVHMAPSALILIQQQVGDALADQEFATSVRAHQCSLQQCHLKQCMMEALKEAIVL